MATFSTPSIQNDLIYQLPHLYISGLDISYASATVIALAPGQARDANDILDMPVGFPDANGNINPAVLFQNYQQPLFINSAVNGANGLDIGTIAASSQYAIFLIGDSRGYKQVAGLISLVSNAAPTLPFGYDSYRLIGFAGTSGASQFTYANAYPQMIKDSIQYYNAPAITVLTGGNSTTFATFMLTTNTAVPSSSTPNQIIQALVTFTPAAAGDIVQFRPGDSTVTTGLVTITGQVAGVAQTQYVTLIADTSQEIGYKVTSGSDSVTVAVAAYNAVSLSAYPQ